jgi:hypothetical protein
MDLEIKLLSFFLSERDYFLGGPSTVFYFF